VWTCGALSSLMEPFWLGGRIGPYPLNPLLNIQQVVSRYYPEQRLTMFEAIRYYTFGGAYASHEEDIKGTLDVGKLADIVVLSRNLLTIKPQDIPKTEVLYTIVGGKIVYQKSP